MSWQDAIHSVNDQWNLDIQLPVTAENVSALKLKYLSKKGLVSGLMRGLGQLDADSRPLFGEKINQLRQAIQTFLDEQQENLDKKALAEKLDQETLDITLPSKSCQCGGIHPITFTLEKVLKAMSELGFSVQTGPDIDSDFYNFEALNFPADHPARDMQDTFYLSKDYLLRTHTSNTQVRIMEKMTPPIRVAIPGKCFRNETVTARSHVLFHQVEAVYIAKDVTLGDLLSTLEIFYKKFFEKDVAVRVRPSFFPFVEPGLEVDVYCWLCSGKGCSTCKGTGWLEVAGAGMIHPNVLSSGGIDPNVYSGFAWGMGVERLAMLLHSIPDIRLFTDNEVRFLDQFKRFSI